MYTCFTGKKGSTRPRGEACRCSNDKSSSSEKAASADFMSTSPSIVTFPTRESSYIALFKSETFRFN